jgi:(p)ppGpp synthase/HD superfamily hydrolase
MPTVDETIAFIKKAHEGQTDKSGKPYWLHPVAVMHRLGENASEQEKLTALLHDVIEDTDYTAEQLLAMGYKKAVVTAVQMLSREKGPNRPTYIEWIRSIAASGNEIVIKVKIADNEENSDPARVAQLPPEERDIVKRYARSLEILRATPTGARGINEASSTAMKLP